MMTIGGFYNITGINGTFPDQSRRNWKNLPTAITKSGTTYNYRYDHAGLRVYKQEGDNIHTLRGAFGEVLAAYKNGLLDYWNIVRPDGVVIGRREGSNRLYYHRDHLGSTRAVVNASGSVVQTYDYYPFGLEMPGRSLTSGTTARERFTGHERDEEVGLDYMQARRYAAEFGRFLSVDPMADVYPGWSPYTYALNNPLKFIDPTGLCPENPESDIECIDGGELGEIVVTAQRPSSASTISFTSVALVGARAGGQVLVRSYNPYAVSIGLLLLGGAVVSDQFIETPAQRMIQTASSTRRSLDNPESLKGATKEEVENLIPGSWTKSPARTGKGTRYANPAANGEQVRIMDGDPTDPNPVKRGPYARVSKEGKRSEPIPLKGNGVLQ